MATNNATSIKIPLSGSLVASYRETCMWPKGLPGSGFFDPLSGMQLTMLEITRTNEYEKIATPSGKVFEIPKMTFVFEKWNGAPIQNTYNNKAVINYDNEPLFAELAILRSFQKNGWDGAWVDSYRNKYRIGLPEKIEPIELPRQQKKLIDSIKKLTKRSGGCWDVFIWKDKELKFIESKRIKKDELRFNQLLWLEKSVEFGLTPENFILAEWDFEK